MRASRRQFVLLLTLQPLSGQEPTDTLKHEALAFDKCWHPFLLGLFGCDPKKTPSQETCYLPSSHIDVRLYEKARDKAKALFKLKD